jgi:1-acyl-sn-glycerol-3-phosphate acyltransferase
MNYQVERYKEAEYPERYAKSVQRSNRILNILYGIEPRGIDNIPLEGAAILAFIHRSYKDPWILGSQVPRAVYGMGKTQLQSWYYLGLGRVYLANRGTRYVTREDPAPDELKPFYRLLLEGKAIATAPEGTSKNRGVKVGEMKFGVGRIAAKIIHKEVECNIVPIAIGSERAEFRRPIPVIVGEPFAPEIRATSLRQAGEEANEKLMYRLQELNEIAYSMRAGEL